MPDATTVWLFRERLVKAKAIDRLFARFDAALTDRGFLAMGGQIIDATVVPAPKQRNTQEEKAAIKDGRIPERWKDKPAKLRQKDRDARWIVKYTKAKVKDGADPEAFKPVDLAIPMFGYKNHISIDRTHGLIRTWVPAPPMAQGCRSSSARTTRPRAYGPTQPTAPRRTRRSWPKVCSPAISTSESRTAGPCPSARANAKRSAVRSAVEHVFAGQKHRMGLIVRTIGIARARIMIGMANLAYNIQRLAWLEGRTAPA
ncbi:hypothetical protein HNO88_004401 [Novosphingobium chloroacetimidivorans]|uniref:Transposase n=1 Tax=Novosphingobium chloroacetimidivorans TaxID=1428314 RepID=A0A7W7NXU9_9SPHN|nr:hypothetical protein [Novosphingobium chloroacetimidivorans]